MELKAGWEPETVGCDVTKSNLKWIQISNILKSHLGQKFSFLSEMHPDGGGEGCQGWGMSDATWHVFSRANMHKHAKGEEGETEGEESEPWGAQKRGNKGRGENGTHGLAFKQRISSLYLVFPPLFLFS